jgi:hypothetical protein
MKKIVKKVEIDYEIEGKFPQELEDSIILACFADNSKMLSSEEYIYNTSHNEAFFDMYKPGDFEFICRINSIKYGEI